MLAGPTRRMVLRGPVTLAPARTPRKNALSPRAGDTRDRGLPPPAAAELDGLGLAARVRQINVLVNQLLSFENFP